MSERLDVLDQGGSTPDPANERPRAGRRDRRTTVQQMDEGTFLPRHVAGRDRHDADAHASPSDRRTLPHGGLDRAPGTRRGGVHTDDHLVGIHGGGGELRAVEHEVRAERHQDPVLLARRLPLAPVHDDERTALPTADRAHLHGGRERGAAAASQTCGVDRVDQLGAGGSTRRRRRRERGAVFAQAHRCGSIEMRAQPATLALGSRVPELLTARPRCSKRRR